MRHRKSGVKLNRTTSHRDAMFRNMVTSLLKYERIRTTDTKAKELRKWADHIITLAKRGDLHARRQALSIVREKDVVHKIFAEASDRFGNINGGYTRIVKIGQRPGDAAPISLIELVSADEKAKKSKKKAKKKIKAEPVAPAQPKQETAPAEAKAEEAGAEATAVETQQPKAAEASAEEGDAPESAEAVAQEADAGSDEATAEASHDDTDTDKKDLT